MPKSLNGHLCPGLHAAAKIAIFRVLAKNRKNRKVDDFFAFTCDFSQFLVTGLVKAPIILSTKRNCFCDFERF